MNKKSNGHIKERSEMVKIIAKHYFALIPKKIEYKAAGMTNSVFEIKLPDGDYIVRIGEQQNKLQDYIKEQWVTQRVKQAGVPIADIMEVGCELISEPYMLQKKMQGETALYHKSNRKILNELGAYAKLIHSVPTIGFGKVFDWSHNVLSKSKTWKKFLLGEWEAYHRLEILEKYKMLDDAQVKKIKSFLSKSTKWKDISPHLNHGDLRFKNVIVDRAGKIAAVIDWEDSCSNIAPLWDLSIALHDLSVDEKQAFLTGYGLSSDDIKELSPALKVLNVLNYATTIKGFADNKNKEMLSLYRVRLHGYLDLYTG